MVVSLKANKKRILAFLILAVIVVGACVFLKLSGDKEEPQDISGGTNEERVAYLESFGWKVCAEPAETREVMIPAQFNDVYTTYNVMQKAQGFDLKPYAGEVCTQYKYKIDNYPGEPEVYATLLVYGEIIIGGDLACAEVDGFMHGFAADSARYGETGAKEKTGTSSENPRAKKKSKTEEKTSSLSSDGEESSSAAAEETEAEIELEADGEVTEEESVSTAGEPVSEDAYPTD